MFYLGYRVCNPRRGIQQQMPNLFALLNDILCRIIHKRADHQNGNLPDLNTQVKWGLSLPLFNILKAVRASHQKKN